MPFNKGNIVKTKTSFWGGTLDESQEEVGKQYVIEYSYGEQFGNGEISGGYSIISMEDGSSSAWWDEDKLEFVSEGSLKLIEELQNKWKVHVEEFEDLKWIKENWNMGSIPYQSILKLFDEVGFETSFLKNGEYAILFSQWQRMMYIYDDLFNNNLEEMNYHINQIMKPEKVDYYLEEFTKLFKKVNN